MSFLFFIVDVLRSWGLVDLGGTVPTRTSQFLELVNNMPKLPGACAPNYLLLGFHITHSLGYSSPTLITPGPSTRKLGTASMPQSLLILFKVAHPKSAYLSHLFLPTETIINALVQVFPLLPPPPASNPGASLYGPVWHAIFPASKYLWV